MTDNNGLVGELNEQPELHIQWKGTDVCIDVECDCGWNGSHFDGMFLYSYRCPKCGTVWKMPDILRPTKLTKEGAEDAKMVAEFDTSYGDDGLNNMGEEILAISNTDFISGSIDKLDDKFNETHELCKTISNMMARLDAVDKADMIIRCGKVMDKHYKMMSKL